jgi:hypothetical protein
VLGALATPNNRRITLLLLAAAGALVLAGLLFGVSDNPPGIVLVSIAAVAIVAAAVHPWRTPWPFVYLLVASIIGFVVLVMLHNLLDGAAGLMSEGNVLRLLLQGVGVAAFLLAVLILPAAVLVGAAGAIIMFLRDRWSLYRSTHAA